MILDDDVLDTLQAKGEGRTQSVEHARLYIAELIDEFWRYFKDPSDYMYKVPDVCDDGIEHYILGEWRLTEPLVILSGNKVLIRIPYQGSYLPLTKSGDTGLYISDTSKDNIEQVLAEIKHAVLTGEADDFFISTEDRCLQVM